MRFFPFLLGSRNQKLFVNVRIEPNKTFLNQYFLHHFFNFVQRKILSCQSIFRKKGSGERQANAHLKNWQSKNVRQWLWSSMHVTEYSSLLFSSCHLELVMSENSWCFACYFDKLQAKSQLFSKITCSRWLERFCLLFLNSQF